MTFAEHSTADWLRERADTYWRDAQNMPADQPSRLIWAIAYQTIAEELRSAAARLDGSAS